MQEAFIVAKVVRRSIGVALTARLGRFRSWPPAGLLLDAPLALAEGRTNRLRRIYAHASRDAWDGPELFRQAMAKHGGIQLSPEREVVVEQADLRGGEEIGDGSHPRRDRA